MGHHSLHPPVKTRIPHVGERKIGRNENAGQNRTARREVDGAQHRLVGEKIVIVSANSPSLGHAPVHIRPPPDHAPIRNHGDVDGVFYCPDRGPVAVAFVVRAAASAAVHRKERGACVLQHLGKAHGALDAVEHPHLDR